MKAGLVIARTMFLGAISILLLVIVFGFQNMTPLVNSTNGAQIEKCGAAPGTLPLTSVPLIYKSKIAANWGKTGEAPFTCPAIPTIPASFNPPKSHLPDNVTLDLAYIAHMKPWNDYLIAVNDLGDLYLANRSPAVATCLMNWLNAWSSTRLLSRTTDYPKYYTAYSTTQGEYDRIAVPGILIMNYLKINGETLNATQVSNFKTWMSSIIGPMRLFITNRESKIWSDRNNHSYWAGLSNLLYADAFSNMDSLEAKWAIARYDMGVYSIQSNGTLPSELMRNEKAAVYHQYAMMPLVMMAEIGERNGRPMYSRNSWAIRRLKNLIVDYYADPSIMETLTNGFVQTTTPGIYFLQDTVYLSWMEIWYTRFGDRDLKPLVAKARYWGRLMNKTSNRRQGGDLTLMFGVSDCHLPMNSVDTVEFLITDIACKAAGSCSRTPACPVGYEVHAARASCKFDASTVSSNSVPSEWKSSVVLNRLSVESDSVGSGRCQIVDQSISSGMRVIVLPFSSSVNVSCSASSPSSCSMRGEVTCGRVKP